MDASQAVGAAGMVRLIILPVYKKHNNNISQDVAMQTGTGSNVYRVRYLDAVGCVQLTMRSNKYLKK